MKPFLLMLALSWFAVLPSATNASDEETNLKKCVYIASYAKDYEWQSRLSKTIHTKLNPHCDIVSFSIDSNKNTSEASVEKRSKQALTFLQQQSPDVAIFSDDLAIQKVLIPFAKQSDSPIVFCGVNQSTQHYSLPAKNITGMIEKEPVEKIFQLFNALSPSKKFINLALLLPQGDSEKINSTAFIQASLEGHLTLRVIPTRTMDDWTKEYDALQQNTKIDGIILGNILALEGWDEQRAANVIKKTTTKPTISYATNMKPFSLLTVEKSGAEQGEWAALSAIEILKGTPAHNIPIVPSHEFKIWLNKDIENQLTEKVIPYQMKYKLNPFQGQDK